MSDDQVIRTDENVFPIFYKKKELPLEKTKQLQEMIKELMEENEKTMADEKLMLDKIREKDDKFIKRLEYHLENFKMAGIEKIILRRDLLPVWSQAEKSMNTVDNKVPVMDDTTASLVEWHNTMTTYVDLQSDEVEQIINDWFSNMDKISNEGEPDPEIEGKKCVETVDSENTWENTFWYIIFMLVCAINIFIYYKPESIKECLEDGFYKCFVLNVMKVGAFLRDHYLNFHNITLDYPSIPLKNISNASKPLTALFPLQLNVQN